MEALHTSMYTGWFRRSRHRIWRLRFLWSVQVQCKLWYQRGFTSEIWGSLGPTLPCLPGSLEHLGRNQWSLQLGGLRAGQALTQVCLSWYCPVSNSCGLSLFHDSKRELWVNPRQPLQHQLLRRSFILLRPQKDGRQSVFYTLNQGFLVHHYSSIK